MKSLAFFALSAIATAAMAASPVADEIVINGRSTQTTSMASSNASNTANADTTALQNLASNSGDITIRGGGSSSQTVNARTGSNVFNTATGADAYANQNLSSNHGHVTISAASTQLTDLTSSLVANSANGRDAKAVQNVSSNNSCMGCLDRKGGGMYGGR
jgi:hypothetical protein